MFPSLRINTEAQPIHKTSLTTAQITSLKGQVYDINSDDNNATQYQEIRKIVEQMDTHFENDYDQMEIAMLKTTLGGLGRGRSGSKPHELINVITKVLDRVTNTANNAKGGSRKRKTRKSAAKRKSSRRTHRK
jgi:hypothetical protein